MQLTPFLKIAIVLLLISMGLFSFFLYNVIRFESYKKIQATVVAAVCTTRQNDIRCNLTLSYTVDKKSYNKTLTVYSNSLFNVNDTITIFHDPSDPLDVIIFLNQIPNYVLAGVFGGLMVLSAGYIVAKWSRSGRIRKSK